MASTIEQPFISYFNEWNIDTTLFPMTHLEWPVFLSLFYIFTVAYYQPPRAKVFPSEAKQSIPTPTFCQKLVLSLHNLALCIFSALCFYNTAPVIYDMMFNIGWRKASCGLLAKEYDNAYGFWCFLFYLSKYYEYVDTYIVIWKKRRPIFLQKFHHVGAAIGMWLVVTTRATCGYIFVVENSFIHSIMYLYYALSVWKIKIPVNTLCIVC